MGMPMAYGEKQARNQTHRRVHGHVRPGRALASGLMGLLLLTACGRGDNGRKHAFAESSSRGAEDRLIAAALANAGRSGKTVTLAGADTLHVGPSALAFYRSRGWRSAWTDEHGLTDAGKSVLGQLARTGDDGLSPERYHSSTAR